MALPLDQPIATLVHLIKVTERVLNTSCAMALNGSDCFPLRNATGKVVQLACVDQDDAGQAAKDYERYAETLADFDVIAFVGHMLNHTVDPIKTA